MIPERLIEKVSSRRENPVCSAVIPNLAVSVVISFYFVPAFCKFFKVGKGDFRSLSTLYVIAEVGVKKRFPVKKKHLFLSRLHRQSFFFSQNRLAQLFVQRGFFFNAQRNGTLLQPEGFQNA